MANSNSPDERPTDPAWEKYQELKRIHKQQEKEIEYREVDNERVKSNDDKDSETGT